MADKEQKKDEPHVEVLKGSIYDPVDKGVPDPEEKKEED